MNENQPTPEPTITLTPEAAKKIASLQDRIPAAVGAANAIAVTDDRTAQLAVNARALLKEREKEGEALRKGIVGAHDTFVESINAMFRPLKKAIDAAVKHVDAQLVNWRKEKQRRIDEENRRREAEAERARQEAAKKAADEAAAAGNFTPQETAEYAQAAAEEVEAPAPIPEAPKTVRTSFGSASAKSVLDFEITNLAALVAAFPDVVEVRRGKVLDLGRGAEKLAPIPEDGIVPFIPGVRFFRRDAISG